jgi:hypothetical protein
LMAYPVMVVESNSVVRVGKRWATHERKVWQPIDAWGDGAWYRFWVR